MSRVLRLRAVANQAGEFFCPDQKEILDTLHMFQWETSQMPLIKYEKDMQIWHHQASVFPVTENKYMLQEDVEALRKACKMWNPVIETFTGRLRLVIVVDGKVITEELLNEYEEVLERAWDVRVIYSGKTSSERLWDVMRGAWGIVIGGGCGLEVSGWNWLLPKEAVVVEIQGNQAPNATAFHMSSIANLEHRFVNTTDRNKVFDEIWNEYERTKEKETEDSPSINELNVSNEVRIVLTNIKEVAQEFQTVEDRIGYPVQDYWKTSTQMIEPMRRWIEGENASIICQEHGLFEGNFIRSVMKMSNMLDEVLAMATYCQHTEQINKIMEVKQKIVRDIVISDSLYLHI
jgi:hypothetical protein